MSIPSSNLLRAALRVIKPFPVTYFPFSDRSTNDRGEFVSDYDQSFTIRGSLQAVPRDMYVELGLDFSKSYLRGFFEYKAQGISRGKSGDMFITKEGKKFEVISTTDWLWDKWCEVLAVEIV